MGVNTVQHGEQAGPKHSVSRLHGTQGVLDQGDGRALCARGSGGGIGGTREPQTARAEEDDGIHATVLKALDAAFNLYGIHYAAKNPKAQLGLRPVVLAQERSGRLFCRRVNYCQFNHILVRECMGAKGAEWRRSLQGCDRVLRQEQEEDRGGKSQDRALEPQVGHRRTSRQGSQGTNQGRDAEQGACNATAGDVAGNVTAARAQHRTVVTERRIIMEAMHRTESVQLASCRRGARAASSNQNFKSDLSLLPD